MKKNKFLERLDKFVAGKGFYIALFVCVAVIGITSWAILFTGNNQNEPDTGAMYSSLDIPSSDTGSFSSKDSSASSKDSSPVSESIEPDSSSDAPSDSHSDIEQNSSQTPDDSSAINEENVNNPVSAEDAVYVWPVVGKILSEHSLDTLVYNITMADWRTHDGVDIAAEKGTTVLAVSSGTIASVYDDDLYGTTVIIDHGNGLKSIYSNLAALPTVKAGDSISVGEVIGSIGNTAIGEINEESHLHLAMSYNDVSVNPLDYLPKQP